MGFWSDLGDKSELRFSVRRNGWTDPRFPQVVCWMYAIFNIATLYAVEVPSIHGAWATALAAIAGVIIGVYVTMVIYITSIDPTMDSLKMKIYKSDHKIPQYVRSASQPHVVSGNNCFVCKAYVVDTKHCQNCNKCIPGFDHHCPWINNCIGRHNHRSYYAMLISWAVANVMMIASSAFVFANTLLEDNKLASDFYWRNVSGRLTVQIILGIKIASLLGVTGYLSWLLKYHTYLARKGLTSYSLLKLYREKLGVADDVERQAAAPEPQTDSVETPLGACQRLKNFYNAKRNRVVTLNTNLNV